MRMNFKHNKSQASKAEHYTYYKASASEDIYVKLHDVNWAFPNDYNYQF